MVTCEFCKQQFKQITNTHLNSHSMSLTTYRILFPNTSMICDDALAKRKRLIVSQETREKISKALRGRHISLEHRRNIALGKRGHSFTQEGRINLSLGQIKRFSNPEEREKVGLSQLEYWNCLNKEEQVSKIEAMLKSNEAWGNKPGANARKKAIAEGNRRAWSLMTPEERRKIAYRALETSIARRTNHRPKARPNKAEGILQRILNTYFPNQWKYTGNGEVWIGIYNPDFLNIDGRKAIIELFGDYWHSEDSPESKVSYYNKYGFKSLIIWESELKEEKAIVQRITKLSMSCSKRCHGRQY